MRSRRTTTTKRGLVTQPPLELRVRSALPVRSPALAVEGPDELVGLGIVGEAHLGSVPFELAFHSQGCHSQNHPFHEGTGNAEIGAGRFPTFAGADPIMIVSRRPAQHLLREAVVLHLLDRDQARRLTVRSGG